MDDLRRYVAEILMFKQHGWAPEEMKFFVTGCAETWRETWRHARGADGLIDDSCALLLYLTEIEWGSDDAATRLGSDVRVTEDEGDGGPWPIGTSMRRAMERELRR